MITVASIILLLALFLGILLIVKNSTKNKCLGGCIVLNTNKSTYAVNERVTLSISSVSKEGRVQCKSNIKITIKGPGKYREELSTENGKITQPMYCEEGNGYSSVPDYITNFIPQNEGEYKINIKDINTNRKTGIIIEARNDKKLSIKRTTATRVSYQESTKRYAVILEVTTQEELNGKLVEVIPTSFDIIWQGNSKAGNTEKNKTLTWDVNLKAGESKEYIYEYLPAKNAMQVFTLGKAYLLQNEIKFYEEKNYWYLINTYDFK